MREHISLIQLRHIYAPHPSVEKEGHIYMPTSLLAACALLLDLGFHVAIGDENIDQTPVLTDVVGINLVGAPYIPAAIEFAKRMERRFGDRYTLVVGGQVVSGLTEANWRKLFNPHVVNGNCRTALATALGVDEGRLPQPENLSLQGAYSLLADEVMDRYISNEFGFYLSQGCKYACSFCAAKKSGYDYVLKRTVKQREIYRDLDIAVSDLEYLLNAAVARGKSDLRLYLSNLDLFQSPDKLQGFAERVIRLRERYKKFPIVMRALSNTRSFVDVHRQLPGVVRDMTRAGLRQVGFGVDGATQKVWKMTHKPQNSDDCVNAIAIARREYGITPETLMVFGHNGVEDEESLRLAYEFTKGMEAEYGSLPRPHVAKDTVPGNEGWYREETHERVDEIISSPILFQNLDFTALPSRLSHPTERFRELVTKYYLAVCDLKSSLTKPVVPYSPDLTERELQQARRLNLRRYDI